jgi:transcriptional regulator with XRE-family HTH domain
MAWPRGKRRHNLGLSEAEVRRIMGDLARYIEANRQAGMTATKMAAYFDVSVRTLGRWLRSEDWPPPKTLEAIREMTYTESLPLPRPYDRATRAQIRAAQNRAARGNAGAEARADGKTPAERTDARYHGQD